MEPRVEVVGRLDAAELERVTLLVEHATEADGARPLSEHVALHLRYGGDTAVRHVLAYDGDDLAGYAHVDPTDIVAGSSAELVVDPAHRGHGVGRRLVSEAIAVDAGRTAPAVGARRPPRRGPPRRVLRHDPHPHPLAAAPLPLRPAPPGHSSRTASRVRTFRPGRGRRALARPERQGLRRPPRAGSLGLHDLHQRMAESWFDPDGFFLAERDDPDDGPRLVGFHWTKVHGGDTAAAHAHEHAHPVDDSDPHGHVARPRPHHGLTRTGTRPSARSTSSGWTRASAATGSAAPSPSSASRTCAPSASPR